MDLCKVNCGRVNTLYLKMQSLRNGSLFSLSGMRHLTDSLKERLQEWLSDLISNHTPPTSPLNSPIAPSKADVVLVVTHEECLLTLLDLLTDSEVVQVDVAKGVDVGRRVDNGRFCIVRVWWDGDGARGRIEGWGVGDLLQED
jgi:hypothetical protein